MKLPERPTLISAVIVVLLTIVAEVPGVNHWLKDVMASNGHLVVLIEGIIGVILVAYAGLKAKGGQDGKTAQQSQPTTKK
jgi:Na+(H+)/acetate symporter ActP